MQMALSLVVIFMEKAMYMCTSMQMVLSLVVYSTSMQKDKYAMTLSLAVDSMYKGQYPKSLVRKLL